MAPKESVAAPVRVCPRGPFGKHGNSDAARLDAAPSDPCFIFMYCFSLFFFSLFFFCSSSFLSLPFWKCGFHMAGEQSEGVQDCLNRKEEKPLHLTPMLGPLGITILKMTGLVPARVSEMSQKVRHPGRSLPGANWRKMR